jgi:mono/diheme cytochrome c family protein
MVQRIAALSLALLAAACRPSTDDGRVLRFERRGELVVARPLTDEASRAATVTVSTRDPYYGAEKRFRALPLAPLLRAAFGAPDVELRGQSFLLEAADGYAVPVRGDLLLDDAAFIAIDDVDRPGFAPIGPKQVSPAPAYLVWAGADKTDLDAYPRPWQLVAVDLVDPHALYPHTVPTGHAEGSPAMLGFGVFRAHCAKCHAINREGGRVGPDLNVPQSIVEYRPEAQIRAYIRDPRTFRYGAMPANPALSEAELDALLAYFQAMSAQKHDPEGGTP